MAWPEPVKRNGKVIGWRGRYRDADGVARDVKDANGKTKIFDRKSDAKALATEKEGEARRRATVDTSPHLANITWGQWWDLLVEKRQFADTDSAWTEESIVRLYLRPKWGDVPLNKIKHKIVEEWIDDLTAGRVSSWNRTTPPKPRYVLKIWGVFHVSITAAVKKGILDASPCAAVENLPRPKKVPKPYIGHTAVTMMSEKGRLREDYRETVDFLLETGLRPGELCGLHASRIDFDRCWMLVCDVLVERRRVIRPHPKDGDTRWVPLTPRALEIIEKRLDQRGRAGGCGYPHTDDIDCDDVLVFLTARHRPLRPHTLTAALKAAAQRAGLPRGAYSGYGGRRGFATLAADGGLDAFALKEILGHSTLDQAAEYVQQTPWARQRLLAALGAPNARMELALQAQTHGQTSPQLTLLPGGALGAPLGADSGTTMSTHVHPSTGQSRG